MAVAKVKPSESWLDYLKRQDPETRRQFPLVVEGTQLFINKFMLAAQSPVFEKALFGEFKEANENEMKLPGKKLKSMIEFLSCSMHYPDRAVNEVALENFAAVYELADEYFIEELLERCTQFLHAKMMSDIPDVSAWIENRVFHTILAHDRLQSKFESQLNSILISTHLREWKSFSSVVPAEQFLQIMIAKEDRSKNYAQVDEKLQRFKMPSRSGGMLCPSCYVNWISTSQPFCYDCGGSAG